MSSDPRSPPLSNPTVNVMRVWATTSFQGLHCWPDAPDEVFWLRNVHHHKFEVRVCVNVSDDDRQAEFLMLSHDIDTVLSKKPQDEVMAWSCEHWARYLAGELASADYHGGYDVYEVTVSEEGVHGATFQPNP